MDDQLIKRFLELEATNKAICDALEKVMSSITGHQEEQSVLIEQIEDLIQCKKIEKNNDVVDLTEYRTIKNEILIMSEALVNVRNVLAQQKIILLKNNKVQEHNAKEMDNLKVEIGGYGRVLNFDQRRDTVSH